MFLNGLKMKNFNTKFICCVAVFVCFCANAFAQPPIDSTDTDTETFDKPQKPKLPPGQDPSIGLYGKWISWVGNPDPKILIFKSDLSRRPNADLELVSTAWDDLAWDWLVSHIPSFKNNKLLANILIAEEGIVLPSNAFSIDSTHKRKGLFEAFYFEFQRFDPQAFSVRYPGTYVGQTANSPIVQYSGFNNRIDTMEEFLFSTKFLDNIEFLSFPYCFRNPLLLHFTPVMFYLPNQWLCTVVSDTVDLIPSSQIGRKAADLDLPQNSAYPNKYIGYQLDDAYSAGLGCWEDSKLVSYLNWYAAEIPNGYERKTHLGKAYFLDIENEILVIGEQNPQTGEWQGDFEAYFLSLNTWYRFDDYFYHYLEEYLDTPILFFKGQHDKNKRVGEWTYYEWTYYDEYSPTKFDKKIDYIDASGKFLRSEIVPFEGFSQAELDKCKQVVNPILEKNKK
jgi:hypothetical protein